MQPSLGLHDAPAKFHPAPFSQEQPSASAMGEEGIFSESTNDNTGQMNRGRL